MGEAGLNGAKDADAGKQQSALLKVMLINGGLAAGLFAAARASDSSALMANALDNLSDATTYAVSYFAVTRSLKWKAAAAAITGVMLLLAAGVLWDAWGRYQAGSEPLGPLMVMMAFLAVVLNYWRIRILRAFRSEDVNLRAAWTMSINDFVSNTGIGAMHYLGHARLLAELGASDAEAALKIKRLEGEGKTAVGLCAGRACWR